MESSMMLNTIPETDLDGVNIQAKILNILKHLVEHDDRASLVMSEDMDHSMYYYRSQALSMIVNHKTTLKINYNHFCFVDAELAEVIFFFYYKVMT
jgi:ABC-type dipeptide/oligopeptide/nickel transport system ATPase subunit